MHFLDSNCPLFWSSMCQTTFGPISSRAYLHASPSVSPTALHTSFHLSPHSSTPTRCLGHQMRQKEDSSSLGGSSLVKDVTSQPSTLYLQSCKINVQPYAAISFSILWYVQMWQCLWGLMAGASCLCAVKGSNNLKEAFIGKTIYLHFTCGSQHR